MADTIRYSKEFFADRASLLAIDLGIEERYKPILQHYIKFFAAKDRTQKFYDLEIENFNKHVIETALMSVICKTKVVSFEEIVRTIITEEELEENKYLVEFEKYNLLEPFWKMCEETFGYTDASPSLTKFIFTLFVTYTSKSIRSELPQAWKNYSSYKSGNILAFLDSLMNSIVYKEDYENIAKMVYNSLSGEIVLSKLSADALVDFEVFYQVDGILIKWLIERLENEDTDAKLNGLSIPEICKKRRKMHYGIVKILKILKRISKTLFKLHMVKMEF